MQMFTQRALVVPKTLQVGTISNHFYYFTETKEIYLYDIYNSPKGEWSIILSKPKKWSFYYNRLDDILTTLEKTDSALARIYPIDKIKLITHILRQKYLNEEERELLKNFQRTENDNRSRKSIGSKNTVKYSIDSAMKNNTLHEFKAASK